MNQQSFSKFKGLKTYSLLKLYLKTKLRRLPLLSNFKITCKPIVLIHQMGKVGSLSIYHSLQAEYTQLFDIYHTHFLNPNYALASDTLRQENNWQCYIQGKDHNGHAIGYYGKTLIHNRLLVKSQYPLNIITMVRDPISRNISAFFQNLHWIFGTSNAYQQKKLAELAQVFWEQADHDFPLDWFDQEIRKVIGLDVYKHKFPHDKGVQQLSAGNHNLLIINTKASNKATRQKL
ncbi:MAG: putative capsular polysaccharide synthesis family protein [Saprospiraceae bacterium]